MVDAIVFVAGEALGGVAGAEKVTEELAEAVEDEAEGEGGDCGEVSGGTAAGALEFAEAAEEADGGDEGAGGGEEELAAAGPGGGAGAAEDAAGEDLDRNPTAPEGVVHVADTGGGFQQEGAALGGPFHVENGFGLHEVLEAAAEGEEFEALVTGVVTGEEGARAARGWLHPGAVADGEVGAADRGGGVAVADDGAGDGTVFPMRGDESGGPGGFGEAVVLGEGDDLAAGEADAGGVGAGDGGEFAGGNAFDVGEACEFGGGGLEGLLAWADEDEFDLVDDGLAAEMRNGGADGVEICGGGADGGEWELGGEDWGSGREGIGAGDLVDPFEGAEAVFY